MDVGSNLDEAVQLQREHEELLSKLKVNVCLSVCMSRCLCVCVCVCVCPALDKAVQLHRKN